MSTTNLYEFTLAEVTVIRFALLYLRSHDAERATRMSADEIVELERKLVWHPLSSSRPGS